jgi:hypothetical protein
LAAVSSICLASSPHRFSSAILSRTSRRDQRFDHDIFDLPPDDVPTSWVRSQTMICAEQVSHVGNALGVTEAKRLLLGITLAVGLQLVAH